MTKRQWANFVISGFCGTENVTKPKAGSREKDIGQTTNKTFCGIQKANSTESRFHLAAKKSEHGQLKLKKRMLYKYFKSGKMQLYDRRRKNKYKWQSKLKNNTN